MRGDGGVQERGKDRKRREGQRKLKKGRIGEGAQVIITCTTI